MRKITETLILEKKLNMAKWRQDDSKQIATMIISVPIP